jgi:hypothetical protein
MAVSSNQLSAISNLADLRLTLYLCTQNPSVEHQPFAVQILALIPAFSEVSTS